MTSSQSWVRFLHDADFFQASEDIGRVAAGVLRVGAHLTEEKGNMPADKDIATRQVSPQGISNHI